jgi:hypothetical protein
VTYLTSARRSVLIFDRPSVTHRGDLIRRAMEPVIPDRIAEEVRSVAERA